MDVVGGVNALSSAHGRLFVVIGVFDGLHRGHAYLLRRLREAAAAREARPAVITFDAHPDEVLTGTAPPLLLDPVERLTRLEGAGVEVTVIQHFDEAVRRTTYEDFVEGIRSRVDVAGFLMTPDAAFGYERRGTPAALAALGERLGFDVVVVPPYSLEGRPVRSTAIREALADGDVGSARAMLGRAPTLHGRAERDGRESELRFDLPVALPAAGTYDVAVGRRRSVLEVTADGRAVLRPGVRTAGLVRVRLLDGRASPGRRRLPE
jgi:riboflavin kinase/FMN adenylyltransferase